MIRRLPRFLALGFYFALLAQTAFSHNNFASRIQAPPTSQTFKDEGWVHWGFSVVKGEDGLYHAYTSRWYPNNLFLWREESRIYHAVSEKPEGPFTLKEELTQLLEQPWAAASVHNPMVKKLKGKYYLYYASYDEMQTHTISVAVSDSASGPWVPSQNNPIISSNAVNTWDALPVNPTAVEKDDGTIVMVYRAWDGDGTRQTKRKLGIALADNPEGPFVRPENNIISDYHLEDPDVWKENGKYWIIAKDMNGEVSGVSGAGIILESEDAITWKLSDPVLAYDRTINWTDDASASYARVERPSVLVVDGKAICLYNAVSVESWRDCFSVARLLSPVGEPVSLSGFIYNPADGSSSVSIKGQPNTRYKLVQASDLDFSIPDQDPIPLDGATVGTLDSGGVFTDSNGDATVQFQLGTGPASFFRAEGSSAVTITWSLGDVSGPSDVSTNGTLVEAFNLVSSTGTTAETVNGVTFALNNKPSPLTSNGAIGMMGAATTGDASYNALLNSAAYNLVPGLSTLTIGGALTVGAQYEVQVWYVDNRVITGGGTNVTGRIVRFGDGDASGIGNFIDLQGDGGGLGQYAIGTFTATAATQTLAMDPQNFGGAQLNAYQLRAIP